MTEEELARMDDNELLDAAERALKQAKWCLGAATVCLVIAVIFGIVGMIG